MDGNKIEEEAYRVLAEAKGRILYLTGLPLGSGKQEDESNPVNSFCTRCGMPVQSTIMKEKILEIAKMINAPAELRCRKCMITLYVDSMARN